MSVPWTRNQRGWNWFSWSTSMRRCNETSDKVSNSGIIEDAKFKTFGCGSAIASSSLITEWVKGKSVDEAHSIKNTKSLIISLTSC